MRKKKCINVDRVKTFIRYHGATWEDMAKYYDCSVSLIRERVRNSYVKKHRAPEYQELSAKSIENEKMKKEAAPVILPPEEEIHEVIVTETGYLMKMGMSNILSESLDIIIPRFCVSELEKLSRGSTVASEVLNLIWSTNRITQLRLKEEILFEEPQYNVKKRTIGIVATCCELFAANMKVRLLTTSYEVAELAKAQDFGPDVKIELVQIT